MLNPPPPLFALAPAAPAEIAKPALVLCSAQADAPNNLPATDAEWWALANTVINDVLDAASHADLVAAAHRHAASIEMLKAHRPDLTTTIRIAFHGRRRQLGGQS